MDLARTARSAVLGALLATAGAASVRADATRAASAPPAWYRVVSVQGSSRVDYDMTKLDTEGAPHLIYRGHEAATLGLHKRVVTGLERGKLDVSIALAGPVTGRMDWANPEPAEGCSPAYDLHAAGGGVRVSLTPAARGRVLAEAWFSITRDLDLAGCAGVVFNAPVGGVFGALRPGLDLSPETPTAGTPGCERYKDEPDLCATVPAVVAAAARVVAG